jgi:hypothetical protein
MRFYPPLCRVTVGRKVRTYSTAFKKNEFDMVCTVGAVPDETTPLYKLVSPEFLSGFVYRGRDEFIVG